MLKRLNINKNKTAVCERILREIYAKDSININDLEIIWLHFENFSSLNIHKYTIFVDENIVFPFTHEDENLMIEGKVEVFNHIIKVSKTKIYTIRSIIKRDILKFECTLPFGMKLMLQKPSLKYKDYDSQLRWKAQFIKLTMNINFISIYLERHPDSNLNSFKSDFFDWIKKHYNNFSNITFYVR
ncbi:hypothetical protein CONCODRAFT_165933 [Conidiobolus coronatus NRRL 28638]|uniref:Uncharacterized protein n=1 Tax=Conidiobolus coronatus (strain ATCC 28846 / CBS 209.66 / NRRL 28638) TaxID=796925 RepID=A0A137PFU2_CONC2|nr:hypothetical protein CONCODRAFT_165933 [Conidiobolus coronatus NRRL 28638]|eukprot:KXN73868.1 hypothetical protein CONCODRAFT_165933 [Conidiobolus coronatus NRRL 28638]